MDGHYKASNITTNLTLPGTHAGIKHYSLTMTPAYNAIPKFFASNRYEQPGKKTPFNLAFNTDLPVFEWRQHNPENAEAGQEFMKHQRIGQTSVWEKGVCLDDFVLSPIDVQNERVLLVDVGGGRGHQCVDLRTKRPDIKGHMITQDLPFCHDMIPNKDDLEAMDIEIMSHDFMTPQPVKGAKIYYLRNVIHNWPDEQATVILSHIKAAMAEDSVLILDDVVMPTVGATWKQTSMDVAMMTMLAAMERTEEQFQHLLEGVGLQITNIWTYDDEYGDSLLFIGAL